MSKGSCFKKKCTFLLLAFFSLETEQPIQPRVGLPSVEFILNLEGFFFSLYFYSRFLCAFIFEIILCQVVALEI